MHREDQSCRYTARPSVCSDVASVLRYPSTAHPYCDLTLKGLPAGSVLENWETQTPDSCSASNGEPVTSVTNPFVL